MQNIGTVLDVRSVAAEYRRKFAGGKRLRTGPSRRAHAVGDARWFGNEVVPGPLCHAGTFSSSPGDYDAVDGPVTCRRCRKILGLPEETPAPASSYQPSLFTITALDQAA